MKKIERREKNHGMNWIRQDKRLAIYLRDGCSCMWCGESVEDGVQLTLDHLKPYSKGGSNSERNLVCCCLKCNSSRQDRTIDEFAEVVSEYVWLEGVTPESILSAIRSNTRKSLKPFREEAKALIERRGSAAKVLAKMGGENK
jgi:5-methylcytosine-specific restriction endonuclease McrA